MIHYIQTDSNGGLLQMYRLAQHVLSVIKNRSSTSKVGKRISTTNLLLLNLLHAFTDIQKGEDRQNNGTAVIFPL